MRKREMMSVCRPSDAGFPLAIGVKIWSTHGAAFNIERFSMHLFKSLNIIAALCLAQLFALPLAVAQEPGVEDDGRSAKIQVGAWFLSPWNPEAAPANFVKANRKSWWVGPHNNKEPLDARYIDPETGLPHSLPRGSFVTSEYFWNQTGFDGAWVLEAIGDARISAGLVRNQKRISKNRVEFVIAKGAKPVMYIQIDRIGAGGLQDIRLYRKEDEARLDAGHHWSSRFIAAASKYDVIRTMDLQTTNAVFINEASDVHPINAAFWATRGGAAGEKASVPLEALFSLGVEADTEIWFQAPIHLGFPYDWGDPAISGGANPVDSMRQVAKAHYEEILASPEWDSYADAVVSALEAAQYPETRMLYIGLGNEIWNFGGFGFRRQTHYADGIGAAIYGEAGDHNRVAYGALTARLMLALDAAFERAGRDQLRIHVIESQAANEYGTWKALEFARRRITQEGRDWGDFAPRMGVAIASYWGGDWSDQMPFPEWQRAIAADPVAAARQRADFLIDGPANIVATRPWILRQFERHNAQAARFGLKVIGAYEGGSHDSRPREIPEGFFNDYLWGPEGARVNEAVNDALLEAYPDIMLSNYALGGRVGWQPWHDGPIGGNTHMQQSWAKYLRH